MITGEVTDYIAGLDEPTRSVLEGIGHARWSLSWKPEEGTSYGMLYRSPLR